MGIISGSGSFQGQFGDHFRVGDNFGGCTALFIPKTLVYLCLAGVRAGDSRDSVLNVPLPVAIGSRKKLLADSDIICCFCRFPSLFRPYFSGPQATRMTSPSNLMKGVGEPLQNGQHLGLEI